jgi:hypothetical protein
MEPQCVSVASALLTGSFAVVAAALTFIIWFKSADSAHCVDVFLYVFIMQAVLLLLSAARASEFMYKRLFRALFVNAALTMHALFTSTVVTTVSIMRVVSAEDFKGPHFAMHTADVVFSNLFAAMVLSILYVRTATLTVKRMCPV